MADAPYVSVSALRKHYGEVKAVDGVDLDIATGEFFTMLGPSGSGKTTTLRLIAGFERPDGGVYPSSRQGRVRTCLPSTATSTRSSRIPRSSSHDRPARTSNTGCA